MIDEKQMKRLPKWAQHEIDRLERNVVSLEEDLAHAYGKRRSKAWVSVTHESFSDAPGSRAWIPDNKVTFELPDGSIEVRLGREGDSLHVMAVFGRGLIVQPRSSNTLDLEVRR